MKKYLIFLSIKIVKLMFNLYPFKTQPNNNYLLYNSNETIGSWHYADCIDMEKLSKYHCTKPDTKLTTYQDLKFK